MSALSPLISCESGALADTIYSHNQHGPYTRPRVVPLDPSTFRQTVMRARFAAVATAWNALPILTKQAWARYADRVPYPGHCGSVIHLTGRQHYFRVNVLRRRHGLAIIPGPPLTYRRVEHFPCTTDYHIGPPVIPIRIIYDTTAEWFVPGGYLLVKFSMRYALSVNFHLGTWFRPINITFPSPSPFFTGYPGWDPLTECFFVVSQAQTPDGRVSGRQLFRVVASP